MTTVGDFSVFYSGSFIVREGADLYFEKIVEGVRVKIRARFVEDETKKGNLEWKSQADGSVLFTFYSWDNSLPTGIASPVSFGQTPKINFYFDVVHHAAGTTHAIIISILTKPKPEASHGE